MSAPSISAQTAAKNYAEFNVLWTTTFEKPSVPPTNLRQLLSLRQIIARTSIPSVDFQTKDPLFPERIKTRDILLEDMNTKIEAIRIKWRKHPGYLNSSHNCWVIAMLQVCLRIPHLRQALIAVGNFFLEGNSFDKLEMQAVREKIALYLQNPAQNQNHLEQAKDHYKKITHSIFRLRTFQILKESEIPANILTHFPIPTEYQTRIRSYTKLTVETLKKEERTADRIARIYDVARKHVLEHVEDGYLARENLLKKCGRDLCEAIRAFDEAAQLNQPVPAAVAQNVRLALHYLSQTRLANGTLSSSFSPTASVSEDSFEGIQKIMSEYERILHVQGAPLPDTYFRTEMTRTWIPDPTSAIEPHDPTFSRLELGRCSSETLNDHQMLITVPEQITLDGLKKPMHLEELLKRNCRYPGTTSARYQREDGRIQRFNCVEVRQVIHGAPPQLSIELNRFIHRINGSFKNYFSVRVPRIMALPAEMTTESKLIAYKLDAFVEHSGTITGGHYIAYVNIDGQWMKCDDGTVTLMTDFEIDVLLDATVGTKTPYFFYYSKLPDQEQQDMLRTAAEMRAHSADIEKEAGTPCIEYLRLLNTLKETSSSLRKLPPNVSPLNDKVLYPFLDLCFEEVRKAPELFNKVLQQFEKYASHEDKIIEYEHYVQSFEHVLTLLYAKGSEEEFLRQFETLPLDIQKQFQDALPVEEGEELTFEGAMKYGTLRQYMRDKLAKHLTVDLSLIGNTLRGKIAHSKKMSQLEQFTLLFDHIKGRANDKQILKMVEFFDFPEEIKNLMYFEVCKAAKVPQNAFHGQRLFQGNPRILAEALVPVEDREPLMSETIVGRLILSVITLK